MSAERVKTIADIARIAGVSKATVSRALNESPLVSTETRERVRAIAEQHGFEMNATARSLSTRQSNVVALATYPYEPFGPSEMPDGSVPGDKLTDAFLLEVMSGLAAGLHARGYDLLVIQIESRDTGWIARYLDSGRVDGFVLMAASCTVKHLEALEARGGAVRCLGAGLDVSRLQHCQRRQLRRRTHRDRRTCWTKDDAGSRSSVAPIRSRNRRIATAATKPHCEPQTSRSTSRLSRTAGSALNRPRRGCASCSSATPTSTRSSHAAT